MSEQKQAAYNQIEDVLEKLKLVMNQFQSIKSPDAIKAWNDASVRYNQLSRMSGTPGEQRNMALQQSRSFLGTGAVHKLITPDLAAAIDQTAHMSPFWNWEADDFGAAKRPQGESPLASNVLYIPPTSKEQPGTIILQNLNFGNSAVAQKIKAAMGPWMTTAQKPMNPNDPKSPMTWETSIRATKESWGRFLELSHLWLDEYEQLANAPAVAGKRFPSEAQFGGNVHPFENEKPQLSLQAQLLNFDNGVSEWELSGKKTTNPKGLRLKFGPNDPNFNKIRDLLVRSNELGLKDVRPYFSQSTIDIYDLNPTKLTMLSQKLKGLGYQTADLNAKISEATGKSIGEVQDRLSKKNKTRDISPQVVANASAKNMRNRIDISLQDFRKEALQRYPAAFDPSKSPPEMQKAQQEGMYFITQRSVSVMADEPGSGKTVQTVVGCDFVTPQDKKILVITPNALVYENWGGTDRKSAPEQFCGHGAEMVARCQSAADVQKALQSNARWIVIPHTSFGNRNDRNQLTALLQQAAQAGTFGASMMDEIQMLKKLDSNTADNIRLCVSESIPFRVGMTGTPADNDPADIYSQLRLLRHPLLYENGTVRQTEAGFTDQFVGGKDAADTSKDALTRAMSALQWAKGVSREQRLAMLDLFSTTFLRRNKEDLRHDIPEKKDSSGPIVSDVNAWAELEEQLKQEEKAERANGSRKFKPWFQTLLMEMGRAKIPHTVATAIDHLQKNQQSKVFIVTGHPEFADEIAAQINQQLGDGTSASVHGETDEDERQVVPSVFKQNHIQNPQGSTLAGKQFPLRCVVYSMGVGAVGLNFSIADKVIFNDMSWNPSTNLQAEYRAHRIDSKHPVDIQYMVLSGTYDEEMFTRVQRKGQLNKAANNILRRVEQARQNPQLKDELAIEYLISVVDSVITDLPLDPRQEQFVAREHEKLVSYLQNQTQPRSVAADSWYQGFKKTAQKYRHLW